MKTTLFPFAGIALVLAACFAAAPALAAEQQGVSKNEIVIGTIQDLSGPLAGYGKQSRNGMQLRIDELNEQGAIHGRKLKLLVEDSGYDPKRAVLAAQKLVNQDKIFIMAGHLGTAQNNAAMPIQFEKQIVNFMPLTASRDMYDAPNELKYALLSSYHDQMRSAARGRSRFENREHGAHRKSLFQARRHRLLNPGRQDEIRGLRTGGLGHDYSRDHRHRGRVA